MKHWQKNCLLSLSLFALVSLSAGCGHSIDDQFVFGKNRIHCDNSTITVTTPFELISDGKQVDLGARDAQVVHAEGHNGNMQLLVTGNKRTEGLTEETLVAQAAGILENNPNLTNVKTDAKEMTLGTVKAHEITFSFTENAKGRQTPLTVKEYIFTQNDVVWRVIYQYRSQDETGKALVERLAGQIALGSEF